MEGETVGGPKSRSSWNEPFSCFAQPLGKVDFNPLKFGRQLQGRIQIIQIKFWEWVNYSLWFRPLFFTSWPPFIFDLHVFTFLFLASFCFGLFLVPSIHSMFGLLLIFISLCCFWIFWPLLFTFTFWISDSETKCECRSGDGNKFRFISDITGSFAMSEPFDPGYLEWQKQMKEEGISSCQHCDSSRAFVSPWSWSRLYAWVLVVML